MVKKEGAKYAVRSMTGKNLGKYRTKKAATKRLKQIEFFKRQKGY